MSSNPSLPQEEQSSSTPKTTGGAEDANDDDEEKILNDKKKIGSSWAYLLAAVAAISIYHHEKKRQDELTAPPLVYTQDTKWMNALRSILSRSNITNKTDTDDSNSTHLNHSEEGILTRDYKPSLVVGTRSTLSSAFAYGASGPKPILIPSRLQVREILSIETDGAKLALDWELPSMASSTKITTLTSTKSTTTTTTSALSEKEKQEQRKQAHSSQHKIQGDLTMTKNSFSFSVNQQ